MNVLAPGRLDFKLEALRALLAAGQWNAVRIVAGIEAGASEGLAPHIEAAVVSAALAAAARKERRQ